MSYLYKFDANNNAKNISKILPDNFIEKDIENILESNPQLILFDSLLIIGRQVKTDTGKIIDLLAIDPTGRVVVIELKRDSAPRDVIAQVIDYASWLDEISERELETIAINYFGKNNKSYTSLFSACKKFFDNSEIVLNRDEVIIVIFAHNFPIEVSRTANFLSERGIYLYCIEFELFGNENDKYITIREISSPIDENKKYNLSRSQIQELSTKQYDRSLFIKLKEMLDAGNDELFYNSKYPVSDKLSVYQPLDGHRIACKISWQYGTGKLEFRIDYFREDNELSITIQTRRKSEEFIGQFNNQIFKNIINQQLTIDYFKSSPFIYYNFPKTTEMNDAIINDISNIFEEMFKPLLEYLLVL